MVCQYFSYLVGYLFTLDIIFWCIVFVFFLILKKFFYLFLFFCCCLCLWCHSRQICHLQCYEALTLFSSNNFTVLGLTFRSLIHFWVLLYSVSDPFSFSCMWISSFPSCVCHPCQKLLDCTCEPLFLDCLLSHWSMSVLMTVPHCFG